MIYKRFLIVCSAVVVALTLFASMVDAGVSIAPAYIELRLDQNRPAGTFTITNVGDKAERYRMMVSHFDFGIKGDLKKIEPDGNSLVPWIKFNPKEFSLPPKSKRSVRFVVAPKGKLPDKAYWDFMELEPLTVNTVKSKNEKGSTFNIQVSTSILVPIFATMGEVTHGANMDGIKVVTDKNGSALEVTVTNEGTGHLFAKVSYEVMDKSGNLHKEGLLAKAFIFPGNKRHFNKLIDGEIPKGDYTVRVICEAKQLKEPISSEIKHTW